MQEVFQATGAKAQRHPEENRIKATQENDDA